MSAMGDLQNDIDAAQALMDNSTGNQVRDLELQLKQTQRWMDQQGDYILTIENMLRSLIKVCKEGTVEEYFSEMEKIEEFLEIANG